jgi:hypothetical protein
MPTNIYKSVHEFPHPTIAPINGVPIYKSIAKINCQLSANAALVQSRTWGLPDV